MDPSKPRPAFKVWIETDDGYVFGPGVYSLLKKLEETGTLKEAASSLGMSYRYAWGLIRKAEEKLGAPLVHAHKGGKHGGGGIELTGLGRHFIVEFTELRDQVSRLSSTHYLESENRVTAVVKDVKTRGDKLTATVDLDSSTLELILRKPVPREMRAGSVVILNFRLESTS
jgi:molybdate transport repressor ModE-like protein